MIKCKNRAARPGAMPGVNFFREKIRMPCERFEEGVNCDKKPGKKPDNKRGTHERWCNIKSLARDPACGERLSEVIQGREEGIFELLLQQCNISLGAPKPDCK